MPWKDDSKAAQRRRLILAIVRTEASVVELCRQAGVSRQTAYKYLRRFEQSGWMGMQERSRRNGRTSRYAQMRDEILALRLRRPRRGARQLLYQLRRVRRKGRLP